MRNTQFFPQSGVKAVPQSLLRLLSPALTVRVSTGCLFTRGLYTGRRCTRLWSDLPRGGRGDELYASLLLAYNKSSVLVSLVWQVTYCVNVGRVEDREA